MILERNLERLLTEQNNIDKPVNNSERRGRDERRNRSSDRESEPDVDALDMASLRLQEWAEPPADQAQFNLSLQEWQVGDAKAAMNLTRLPQPDPGSPSHVVDGAGSRRTRDKTHLTVRFEVGPIHNIRSN